MGRIVFLAAAAFLAMGAVYFLIAALRSARQPSWPHDSPHYRNHLSMARWIERQIDDDMVRVTIPAAEQAEARKLLERFYGERRELGGGSGR